MSNIISYHFPLNSLENQQINNAYKDITVSSGLSDSKIDFDAGRGSFLSLINDDFINITFDLFNIESDKSYVINLFLNYEILSDGISDEPFLNIDDRYKLWVRNNFLFVNNGANEKLSPATWYNVTITVSRNIIKTFLFNKEIASADISTASIKKIRLQAKRTFNFKVSDLSIQEEVNAFALETIRNNQNFNNLSVFSTIHFQLYNKAGYKDRLFLDNNEQHLFLDIDFGKYHVDFDPEKDVHIILKAKKGFFKKKENLPDAAAVSTEGDDFCMKLKASAAIANDHKLSVPVLYAELVNLRNQDQVLVQLELTNCTLKTADHQNIILSEGHSVKIDQTVVIQDNLGADVCPFDVFVFGNDTLPNSGDHAVQLIVLRVMNNAGASMAFGQNSSFEITSGQIEILKNDVLQAANIKVKNRDGIELKIFKDHNLKVSFTENTVIAENQWVDIEISGIQAKTSSTKFPSGSYPFYLEYKNFVGYRSGKTKFYIRTGKIFYSN